ncbi:MAG: hypothetical protein IJK26_10165 [Clostridia bacterium]|nr:hypothetical protein [Clostridia bacterium]
MIDKPYDDLVKEYGNGKSFTVKLDIIPQYMICAKNAFTESEEIVLISREEYNRHIHEFICGCNAKEEARKKFAEVKELGVQGYLKKLIKQEGAIKYGDDNSWNIRRCWTGIKP